MQTQVILEVVSASGGRPDNKYEPILCNLLAAGQMYATSRIAPMAMQIAETV